MKVEYRIRVVMVDPDSARLAARHTRAHEPFTTVRFEDRKHATALRYAPFWTMISRRVL